MAQAVCLLFICISSGCCRETRLGGFSHLWGLKPVLLLFSMYSASTTVPGLSTKPGSVAQYTADSLGVNQRSNIDFSRMMLIYTSQGSITLSASLLIYPPFLYILHGS